jgi:hypothetical protein
MDQFLSQGDERCGSYSPSVVILVAQATLPFLSRQQVSIVSQKARRGKPQDSQDKTYLFGI